MEFFDQSRSRIRVEQPIIFAVCIVGVVQKKSPRFILLLTGKSSVEKVRMVEEYH